MIPDLNQILARQVERAGVEDCFKILRVQGRDDELYVPACIQFKIRNFTEVNFENLTASVYGVLCVNFLIFTDNKPLEQFLSDRIYFNPQEQEIVKINRRKKMERGNDNYIPLLFNKDDNIKVPTTRTKEFQIQSFKTPIKYRKAGANAEGVRIFHTLRKEFTVEIHVNDWTRNFFAPFDFINLELVISLEHMDVGPFQYAEGSEEHRQQERYMDAKVGDVKIGDIKKVNFNLLRIEEPFTQDLQNSQRVQKMAPILSYSCEQPFGVYDVVETQLQAYTHDEREINDDENDEESKRSLFQDHEPTQLHFKPFKYVVFKIPLFRYPVIDMMTIFIPLWLLSFVSVYIYFQTTEIMNRLVNIAGLMIAYAAIQPIVRENLPEAITITLVDLLIYLELLINILFLARTIDVRVLDDGSPNPPTLPLNQTNEGYNRWKDGLFIASLVISIANIAIVMILIFKYMIQSRNYKADPLPRGVFGINDRQNWTLTLLMERGFARYREKLQFLS